MKERNRRLCECGHRMMQHRYKPTIMPSFPTFPCQECRCSEYREQPSMAIRLAREEFGDR